MAQKPIQLVSGVQTEVEANVTSAGGADSGKLVALDAGGKLDVTVMPTSVAAEVIVLASSENLAAGDLVNIWNDAATPKVRKADATVAGKEADGFVLAAVTSPADATVYLPGQENDQASGLTGGNVLYLSEATAGLATPTAPSTSANVVQRVGKAFSATQYIFLPNVPTTLA